MNWFARKRLTSVQQGSISWRWVLRMWPVDAEPLDDLPVDASHMSPSENPLVYISDWAMLSEVGEYEPSQTWAWLIPRCWWCLQIKELAQINVFWKARWLWQPNFLPRLGVFPLKQKSCMSCSFKSLPVHGGPFPKTQYRKAGLCPQKLPTEGEQSSSQSPQRSAMGRFPFTLICQNPGMGAKARTLYHFQAKT